MSHREKERTEDYKKTIEATEAPSVHGAKEVICQFYYRFYSQLISPKSNQDSVRYTSVALCAAGTSMILCLTPSALLLCVPYYVRALVRHSIFWMNP